MLKGAKDQLAYCEPIDNFVDHCRASYHARRAWSEHAACHQRTRHHSDFGKGFKDGFRDKMLGRSGCTPAIPPRIYWNSRFESLEGQQRIEEWFAGYPLGVLAAEERGYGNWHRLQTSLPDYLKHPIGEYPEPAGAEMLKPAESLPEPNNMPPPVHTSQHVPASSLDLRGSLAIASVHQPADHISTSNTAIPFGLSTSEQFDLAGSRISEEPTVMKTAFESPDSR